MTSQEILAIKLEDNDVEATTIGEYLGILLERVWSDGEEFNSKKPFGNSGWQSPVYVALIKAGLIEGTLDEEGSIDTFNWKEADGLITNCIGDIFSAR